MRGTIGRDSWDVPVDLFFYRDPEELEKVEETAAFEYKQEQAAPFSSTNEPEAAAPANPEGGAAAAGGEPNWGNDANWDSNANWKN
jgi:small subunit ribosomal protein SAe